MLNIPIMSSFEVPTKSRTIYNYTTMLHDIHSYFLGDVHYGASMGKRPVIQPKTPEYFSEKYTSKTTYRDIYSKSMIKLALDLKQNYCKCRKCTSYIEIKLDSYSLGHGICGDCFAKLSSDYHREVRGSGIYFSEFIDAKIVSDKLEEMGENNGRNN